MNKFKLLVAVLCVLVACSTTKETTKVEKDNSSSREKTTEKEIVIIKEIHNNYYSNNDSKNQGNSNPQAHNFPENIRLSVTIKDRKIVRHAVLSGQIDLVKQDVKIGNSFSKLYLRSKISGKLYEFIVPHINGEYEITGYEVTH